jgi:hypothetical protein
MIISYVAYCNTHGEIVRLAFGKASNNPPEGVDSQSGQTIVHITGELPVSRDEFVRTHYWDGNSWANRPNKPNPVATWSDSGWTWNQSELISLVKNERVAKLLECDWTQLPDSPLSEIEKIIWQEYRQELRDITNNLDDITNLEDVPWPTKPE